MRSELTRIWLYIAMAAFAVVTLIAGPVNSASAGTVKVEASEQHGRAVTFELRGVEAATIRHAVVRAPGNRRTVRLEQARRAVSSGKLKTRIPANDYSRLRAIERRAGQAGARRWLRRHVLVVRTAKGGSSEPAPAPAPVAPSAPAAPGDQLLISAERLASLPTSGAAYASLQQRADAALSGLNLSSQPSAASPWLPNYNGSGSVSRPGVQTLAAALIYARTGDGRYRDLVIEANRYLIGTEDEASNGGTSSNDKLLATVRQIGSFVMAADLVDMDPALTGSRRGWEGKSWASWLSELRTKPIGTSGQASTIIELSNERANNWGSFATAARISIDAYLGDRADLEAAAARLRLFLGETTDATSWIADQDLDLSFACRTSAAAWTGINGSSCGPAKDGMIVEDISRSATSFPSYDSTGIGYTMESYQALLLSAVLLERQGYDPFQWGDQALRRTMDWLTREGIPQGNGSSVETHVSWIPQYFYGKSYPTVAAGMGRSLGFTDWLFAR